MRKRLWTRSRKIFCILLLLGGVLYSCLWSVCDFVKPAYLQKAVRDIGEVMKAAQSFKRTYGYLPGDLPTATQLWGMSATCAVDYGVSSASGVCDGNGDGKIEGPLEIAQFWKQITPIDSEKLPSRPDAKTKKGWPIFAQQQLKFSHTQVTSILGLRIWSRTAEDMIPVSVVYRDGHNVLQIGSLPVAETSHPTTMSPEAALALDAKLDDGNPSTGSVQSLPNPECAEIEAQLAKSYSQREHSSVCAVTIRID